MRNAVRISKRLEIVDTDWAIDKVNEWGYPRILGEHERKKCTFYSVKNDSGLIWFSKFHFELSSEIELTMHLAFEPSQHRRVFSMQLWGEILALALHLGGVRIWALRPDDVMRDYCLRLGFVQDIIIKDYYCFDLIGD